MLKGLVFSYIVIVALSAANNCSPRTRANTRQTRELFAKKIGEFSANPWRTGEQVHQFLTNMCLPRTIVRQCSPKFVRHGEQRRTMFASDTGEYSPPRTLFTGVRGELCSLVFAANKVRRCSPGRIYGQVESCLDGFLR